MRLIHLAKKSILILFYITMTYVITSHCHDCKYTYCAAVCPVDAFHEGEKQLFINPESCIDCNACQSECPIEAIYPEDQLPQEESEALAWNAQQSQITPIIRGTLEPLRGPACINPTAD